MKKFTPVLLASFMLFGAVACADGAKTSADAPNTITDAPEVLDADEAQESQEDGQSQVRQNQLNADIRAREERNNALNEGAAEGRSDDDLESEVRSKLEANLPASALVIEAEDGAVTVSGTVPTQEQFERIEPLAKEIKGVQAVNVKAAVAPAQPKENN